VVTTLPLGTVLIANGRTADQIWIVGQVAVKDDEEPDGEEASAQGESGWLQVAQVIAVGIEFLPVYDASSDAPSAAPIEGEAAEAEAEGAPMPTDPAATGSVVMTGTVASGSSRLNVRGGPGTTYAILAKVLAGESYAVVGRTADGRWLQIERGQVDEQSAESWATGWVAAEYLQINGDISMMSVVTDIVPPSTLTPTSTTTTAPSNTGSTSDLQGTLTIESSPGGMIYAYDLGSGSLWPLSNGFDPAISPDGQTVAFVRDGGENGIYLIDRDGSDERLIFSGRARLSSPKWSPDGQWIVFTRSDGEYHCLELGGSCITPPSAPDGREFTIPGVDPVTRYWYNLARVDRDGNNYRDVASLTSARAADWNEAGIVYQSNAGLQITADTPDAENRLVIFDYLKPFFDDPDWQPNGGRIVYMGKEASHWELFIVNADGSGKWALTRPATTVVDEIPSHVAAAWSPDGQHIAFLSNREANGEAGAWRVWVMEADGANQRALSIDLAITYTFGGEQSLSWSR
jgi:hypothetical protein